MIGSGPIDCSLPGVKFSEPSAASSRSANELHGLCPKLWIHVGSSRRFFSTHSWDVLVKWAHYSQYLKNAPKHQSGLNSISCSSIHKDFSQGFVQIDHDLDSAKMSEILRKNHSLPSIISFKSWHQPFDFVDMTQLYLVSCHRRHTPVNAERTRSPWSWSWSPRGWFSYGKGSMANVGIATLCLPAIFVMVFNCTTYKYGDEWGMVFGIAIPRLYMIFHQKLQWQWIFHGYMKEPESISQEIYRNTAALMYAFLHVRS